MDHHFEIMYYISFTSSLAQKRLFPIFSHVLFVTFHHLKPSESILNLFQIETLGIGNPCYHYITLACG